MRFRRVDAADAEADFSNVFPNVNSRFIFT
jgi:hypothetical protein